MTVEKQQFKCVLGKSLIALIAVGLIGCSDNNDGNSSDEEVTEIPVGHPYPQPRPKPSTQVTSEDGTVTRVETTDGLFEQSNPFREPPGNNFLGTVYENIRDGLGNEMANTLPSTPNSPYNLHPDPEVTEINPISPRDDLKQIFDSLQKTLSDGGDIEADKVQMAIDILEGNPIADRIYSGFPLLHYKGPEKQKIPELEYDKEGNVIGGNVNVRQVWYDNHIESDTSFIDPTMVWEVPWTITYTVDVLNRGTDDFSPFVMYFDHPSLSPPNSPRLPHVGMDQSYFPMEDGTRVVYKIGMAPGKYWNLTYTWGWRKHPPRVQVIENALKRFDGKQLPEWEEDVFGLYPSANEQSKLDAIAKIGDLAPAKRMWNRFKQLQSLSESNPDLSDQHRADATEWVADARAAFVQWKDRTKLPDGIEIEEGCDLTLFYGNNTIYGELADGAYGVYYPWETRGADIDVCLTNGDYYPHAYTNIDFGGSRGWENTFQSTADIGGSGPWFTFGRVHWWPIAGVPALGTINVPEATKSNGSDVLGKHKVEIQFNFDPSRRLRFYQFDPRHHDVAVFSVH